MKTVTLEVPDETIVGSVTIVLSAEHGFGLELMTRSFDFQVKNGDLISFKREYVDGGN